MPSGAGGLEDILGAILGGGAAGQPGIGGQASPMPSGAGGLGDILGAILGGGGGQSDMGVTPGAGTGLESLFAPLISGLAAKLGLPPAMAQMVVAFVLGKLFSSQRAARWRRLPCQRRSPPGAAASRPNRPNRAA